MLRLFLRLFGSGKLPPEGHGILSLERARVVLESLCGSITYRKFRAPGRYSRLRRQWFLGSLALTEKRILAYRYRQRLVNIPFDDARIRKVHFSLEEPDTCCMKFDAALFHASASGQIELRFKTPAAEEFYSLLPRELAEPHPVY